MAVHSKCRGTSRGGLRLAVCEKCGARSGVYRNGVSICFMCCAQDELCQMCGKTLVRKPSSLESRVLGPKDGKLFCLIGRSLTGKDTVVKAILDKNIGLHRIVYYTTRPIRGGETDGVEFHFVSWDELRDLMTYEEVVEYQDYQTVHGIWRYCTLNNFDKSKNYIGCVSIASLEKYIDFFGEERIVPILLDASDEEIKRRWEIRNSEGANSSYAEFLRRFEADKEDFSEQRIKDLGIEKVYFNNGDPQELVDEIVKEIQSELGHDK